MAETEPATRVLVSGTNGFIGRALVAHLESERFVVHKIVRGEPAPGQAGLNVDNRTLDTSQLPRGTLDGIDAIVHLAGEPITPVRWSPAKRERIRSSRATTTDVLARAIARAEDPPSTFVCASAIGIYGNRGDTILDEQSSAGTGFLAEVCRAWEAAAAPAKRVGTRVLHARTGIVLGATGGVLATQVPLYRYGLGGQLGDGNQWMSWISLHDEIAALHHLVATSELSGPFNLTAPQPTTNAAFTETFAQLFGHRSHYAVSRRGLRIVAGRQVTSEVLLASQRVISRRLQDSGFQFTHTHLDDALRDAIDQPGSSIFDTFRRAIMHR